MNLEPEKVIEELARAIESYPPGPPKHILQEVQRLLNTYALRIIALKTMLDRVEALALTASGFNQPIYTSDILSALKEPKDGK